MGVTERKEREKEALRNQILQAAQQLFLEKGFEKVSIRNIAEAIEYSPATIYLYFKDKNELLLALHQLAFGELVQQFGSLAQIARPYDRLTEMGHIYLRFAMHHPELYELVFLMKAPMEAIEAACGPSDPSWDNGKRAFDLVVETVRQCIAEGILRAEDPEATGLMIWSQVHGMAALLLRKRMMIFPPERRESIVREAYEVFLKTLPLR